MSKTVLAQVDGFTPIIDSVVADVGIIGAAIFGRMWRYCQMENGVCHASLGTIADDLGINVRTVIRYSDKLVEKGYLKDRTPDLRNEPHIYSDTGKAGISINVTGRGMTESHSRHDRKSHRAMTESHLKKEVKKEEKIDDTQSIKTVDIKAAFSSLITYPINWAAGSGASAKWLAENGYTPDDVIGCYKAMAADPWWKDKEITLKNVANKIGAWKQSTAKRKVIMING